MAVKIGLIQVDSSGAKGSLGQEEEHEESTRANAALLIAEQINFCREQLVAFNTAYQIRQMLSEKWGLPEERTADNRIKAAREAIRNDASKIDRQDLAAMMIEMAEAIAKESVSYAPDEQRDRRNAAAR